MARSPYKGRLFWRRNLEETSSQVFTSPSGGQQGGGKPKRQRNLGGTPSALCLHPDLPPLGGGVGDLSCWGAHGMDSLQEYPLFPPQVVDSIPPRLPQSVLAGTTSL